MPPDPPHPELDRIYPELAAARAGWRFHAARGCLQSRVILVTGAGDGIGRTAAKTFALYGADVVLLGRGRGKLEAVYDWIVAHTPTRPTIVPCDLAALDEAGAEALAGAIDADYGGLHGLLHNASLLGPRVPIAHYPAEDWARVMTVNVTAPFLLTRALVPGLTAAARTRGAAVVFTSSGVGRAGRAYWGAYAVSKFATEGLMQVFADEVESAGIRVVSVNPGGTRTAMRAAAYPGEDPASVPRPEAHMDLYLYLAGPAAAGEAELVTGAAIDARNWTPFAPENRQPPDS